MMIGCASGAPAAAGPPVASAATSTAAPLPALEWKFSQVFGERAIGEEVQEGACLDRPSGQWFRVPRGIFSSLDEALDFFFLLL